MLIQVVTSQNTGRESAWILEELQLLANQKQILNTLRLGVGKIAFQNISIYAYFGRLR